MIEILFFHFGLVCKEVGGGVFSALGKKTEKAKVEKSQTECKLFNDVQSEMQEGSQRSVSRSYC